MNPDQPSREQIEARITALLCGELPADEAELLRYTISQDPELQKLHDQLKLTIGFVREALKNPVGAQAEKETPIKLSQDKRQKLLEHFNTERSQKLSWLKRIEILSPSSFAIAAIVILMICGLVAISIPNFVKTRSTSQSNSIINNLRQIDAAKEEWAMENHKSLGDVPTSNDLTLYVQAMRPVAGEKYTLGKVFEPAVAEFHGERLTAMQSQAAPENQMALKAENTQSCVPKTTTPPQMAQIVLPNTESQKESELNGDAVSSQRSFDNPAAAPVANLSPGVSASSPTPLAQPPVLATTESSENQSEPETNVFSQNVVGYINVAMPTDAPVVEVPPALPAVTALPAEVPPASLAALPSVAASTEPNPGVSALAPPAGGYNFQPNPASKGPFGNRLQSEVRENDFYEDGAGGGTVAFQATNGQLALSWQTKHAGWQLQNIQPNAAPDVRTVSVGSSSAPNNNFHSRYPYVPANLADALANATNGTPYDNKYINFPDGSVDTSLVATTKAQSLNYRRDKDSSSHEGEVNGQLNATTANGSLKGSVNSMADVTVNTARLPEPMGQGGTSSTIGSSTGLPETVVAQGGTAVTTFSPQQSQEFYNGRAGVGPSQAYRQLKDQHQLGDKIDLGAPPAGTQADRPLIQSPATAPIPQPEIQTRDNPFSTFSLNVSDVSFKLALASLEKGLMPRPSSIHTEEFINAFDYHDPEPLQGQPLAFTCERARNPFEQERDFLRFSVKAGAAGRQAGRALNLVLLLDTSGSMERADRVAIIREALRVLAAQLQPQDTVSVVTFARTARLWADGVPGDQAGATLDQVGSITPEGGTNLEEAMRLAYETALRHFHANGMNRVVLLTDGAANLGNVDPQALTQKVEAERRQGIALDCFGIGWEDYNDDLLEQLSSNGDGRYAFINSPNEAAMEFAAKLAGALQVAAEDVKVQVEFNPNRVTAWRQIGYAKHQLTKEQFRDNSVAAGAIAAREAGNALYVIETNPGGQGPIATVRVRYRVPGTQENYERSWLVDYAGAAPALAQSSSAMRLAVTAAEFSESLAGSPFAQEVTPDELLKYLSGVPQFFNADDRPKQLQSMILQAKSVSGK